MCRTVRPRRSMRRLPLGRSDGRVWCATLWLLSLGRRSSGDYPTRRARAAYRVPQPRRNLPIVVDGPGAGLVCENSHFRPGLTQPPGTGPSAPPHLILRRCGPAAPGWAIGHGGPLCHKTPDPRVWLRRSTSCRHASLSYSRTSPGPKLSRPVRMLGRFADGNYLSVHKVRRFQYTTIASQTQGRRCYDSGKRSGSPPLHRLRPGRMNGKWSPPDPL
jgi:hypothetical protein